MITWTQVAPTYWEASCERFTLRITCSTLDEAQSTAVDLGIQDLKRSLECLGWQPDEKVWFETAQAKLSTIGRLIKQEPGSPLARAIADVLTQTEVD
jgi:hypothetical protein